MCLFRKDQKPQMKGKIRILARNVICMWLEFDHRIIVEEIRIQKWSDIYLKSTVLNAIKLCRSSKKLTALRRNLTPFCCDNCWKEQWHFVKFHLKWNCFSISISNIFRNNWMLIRRLLRWDTLQNEHSLENKFHPGAPRPHLPQANESILSSFILDALRTFPIQNRLENHRKWVEEHQN